MKNKRQMEELMGVPKGFGSKVILAFDRELTMDRNVKNEENEGMRKFAKRLIISWLIVFATLIAGMLIFVGLPVFFPGYQLESPALYAVTMMQIMIAIFLVPLIPILPMVPLVVAYAVLTRKREEK